MTIGTAGNLGSILAARLSTALHLGTLVFAVDNEPLLGNILAILALSISIFPIVGVGTWGLTTLFADPALTAETVILISITSGTCLAVIAVTVALLATYLAYRFELDPDNVVLPVVTNVCDVLGVVVLVGVAQLFI
ncbi:MAG: divalent cation transporter [Haloquadratum sp. J07HQX50]|nr:MAG: divalent cation transporter [Haloquadratum sp. J07HQX50]